MLFNSRLRDFRVFYMQEKASHCRVLLLCRRGHSKWGIPVRCAWDLHPGGGLAGTPLWKVPSTCPCEPQRGITHHPWVLLGTGHFLRTTEPEPGPGELSRDETRPGGRTWVAPREGERAPASRREQREWKVLHRRSEGVQTSSC